MKDGTRARIEYEKNLSSTAFLIARVEAVTGMKVQLVQVSQTPTVSYVGSTGEVESYEALQANFVEAQSRLVAAQARRAAAEIEPAPVPSQWVGDRYLSTAEIAARSASPSPYPLPSPYPNSDPNNPSLNPNPNSGQYPLPNQYSGDRLAGSNQYPGSNPNQYPYPVDPSSIGRTAEGVPVVNTFGDRPSTAAEIVAEDEGYYNENGDPTLSPAPVPIPSSAPIPTSSPTPVPVPTPQPQPTPTISPVPVRRGPRP